MQYLLQYWSAPDAGPAEGTPEAAAEFAAWMTYSGELDAAGVAVGGEALLGPETATTVRVRQGATVTTDGPFAETKEVLGGYHVIEVADLDEAIRWSEKAPHVGYGCIEIRPIMDLSGMQEG